MNFQFDDGGIHHAQPRMHLSWRRDDPQFIEGELWDCIQCRVEQRGEAQGTITKSL